LASPKGLLFKNLTPSAYDEASGISRVAKKFRAAKSESTPQSTKRRHRDTRSPPPKDTGYHIPQSTNPPDLTYATNVPSETSTTNPHPDMPPIDPRILQQDLLSYGSHDRKLGLTEMKTQNEEATANIETKTVESTDHFTLQFPSLPAKATEDKTGVTLTDSKEISLLKMRMPGCRENSISMPHGPVTRAKKRAAELESEDAGYGKRLRLKRCFEAEDKRLRMVRSGRPGVIRTQGTASGNSRLPVQRRSHSPPLTRSRSRRQ
jgi:hypothetical protein